MLKMSPSYLTYLRMQKQKTLILICNLGLDTHASLSAYAVLFKSIVNMESLSMPYLSIIWYSVEL